MGEIVMSKTSVITGAGSGVGKAVAIALARDGWRVALLGRREASLEETAAACKGAAGQCLVYPCNIADQTAVAKMAQKVLAEFKDVEVLVNAAGTNAPRRA